MKRLGPNSVPTELSCRRLSATDTDEVASLERAAFNEPWSPALVGTELDSPSSVAIGISRTAAGQLLGYALFRLIPPTADLNRIAVVDQERGRGLGSLLLRYGHDALAHAGATECLLEVRDSNTAALRLYSNHGYQHIARRRGYYTNGSDALVLRCPLHPNS